VPGKQDVGRTALALVSAVVCLSASGSQVATTSADDGSWEPATVRGLAAAVLRHVDGNAVESVGGGAIGDGMMAAVGLRGPGPGGITVIVGPAMSARVTSCAADGSGVYSRVTCEPAPSFVELGVLDEPARRRLGDGVDADQMSDLEGLYSGDRGSVIVQVSGDSPENRQLALDLLHDELLGERTSVAMNRAGRAIDDFDTLGVRTTMTTTDGSGSPG
jgi:stage V sporulation protein SpoVS